MHLLYIKYIKRFLVFACKYQSINLFLERKALPKERVFLLAKKTWGEKMEKDGKRIRYLPISLNHAFNHNFVEKCQKAK